MAATALLAGPHFTAGALLALGAGLFYSLYVMVTKGVLPPVSAATITASWSRLPHPCWA